MILWFLLNTYWYLFEGSHLLTWTDNAFLWEVFCNPKSFLKVNHNSGKICQDVNFVEDWYYFSCCLEPSSSLRQSWDSPLRQQATRVDAV